MRVYLSNLPFSLILVVPASTLTSIGVTCVTEVVLVAVGAAAVSVGVKGVSVGGWDVAVGDSGVLAGICVGAAVGAFVGETDVAAGKETVALSVPQAEAARRIVI